MPAPSPLAIATSALQRLVKEEASYHKELRQQQARIVKLEAQLQHGDQEGEEGNAEFMLGQEKRAVEETRAVFPGLQKRIDSSIETLETQLESSGDDASGPEVNKAQDVLEQAKQLRSAA